MNSIRDKFKVNISYKENIAWISNQPHGEVDGKAIFPIKVRVDFNGQSDINKAVLIAIIEANK